MLKCVNGMGGVMKCFKLLKGYFIKKLPFINHSS